MANLAGSFTASSRLPTMLELLLEEINFQRTKEMRQLLKDDSDFVMLQGTTYWTDLFVRHFLFQEDHTIDGDDLLFFVRKKHIKTSSRYLPKFETEVDVFRKDSKKLPIGDPDIDWEETVYLNLVVHQFNYTLTLAICTRTSPKELQVLRRHSQKVYASPSRRRMDAKGDLEEMTYPHICFMVDNFDEVFCDILVRDGEMVCVELVASDREGAVRGVIFLGSIRYDALKKVYDARSSLSTKVAQRMTFGLFSGASSQRVEFVRMKGPQGKGHAEMAVTKPKWSGAETPTSEPGYSVTDALWDADWDDVEELFMNRHQRRLSDPSANLNNFVRGGWRTKPDMFAAKARSESEGLESMANGLNVIDAGDIRDVNDQRSSWGGGVASPVHMVQKENRRSSRARQRETFEKGWDSRKLGNVDDVFQSPKCAGTSKGRHRHCQHHYIEVGSESVLETSAESLTNDNVMQKLDAGAILVNGKEELPLGLESSDCGEPRISSYKNHLCNNSRGFSTSEKVGTEEPVPVHHCRHKFRDYRPRGYSSDDEMVSRKTKSFCNGEYTSGNEDGDQSKIVDIEGKHLKARISRVLDSGQKRRATLPRRRRRRRALSGSVIGSHPLPPHRVTPDGTAIYYWCEVPRRPGSEELDDGAYNPLWTMRAFTQTFHFWKETRRAQSVPLNAFLTYITLPWWSIAKDILDHREDPILTF